MGMIFFLVGVGLNAYALYYYLKMKAFQPDEEAQKRLKTKCFGILSLGTVFILGSLWF